MKKVVLASLLAVACSVPLASSSLAQPQQGGVTMSQEEYKAYNDANTATTPAAKAAGFEAYLKAYPNSTVKLDVLNQLLFAYSQIPDADKTVDAADRLLAVDPNNLRALTFEVYFRRTSGDALTDPTAKCAALDVVAGYAQKGLSAAKPAAMSADDFTKLKAATAPTFYSAIADDDICKKDNAGAIKALTTEIDANAAMTQQASPVLQDVYTLAQSYYTSTPPDYLNCAWYATRFVAFAPEPYKSQVAPLATFCYKRYHGDNTGYDKMQAAVQTSLDPPSGFFATITPAPKPEDIVANLIATTPDLATLAISDKEFVLQYGKPADADKVFDTVKGKAVELPNVTVVTATADQLTVSVSDDAVAGKTADFTFAMKEPIKEADIPAVGAKVTLDGTYGSYTQKPLMIMMTDGALVLPKPPAKKAPVHHTTHK